MWKPTRKEAVKPPRQRLDRLALAILEQAAVEARDTPVKRTRAHRLALAWLTYTDIVSPNHAKDFWDCLGHVGQYGGPKGDFYRQSDPQWMLEGWKQRAGIA